MTASVSLRLGVRAGGRLKGQVCLWEWRAWIEGLGEALGPTTRCRTTGRKGSGWGRWWGQAGIGMVACPLGQRSGSSSLPSLLVGPVTYPSTHLPCCCLLPLWKELSALLLPDNLHPPTTLRPKRMTQPEPRTGCPSTTSSPTTCSSGWSSQEVSPVPGGCARAASAHTSSGPGSAHMPF